MYWQGETDAQCSPFRDAASSLLASGEGWKRELIGSFTPTSTLDASHSRLAGERRRQMEREGGGGGAGERGSGAQRP